MEVNVYTILAPVQSFDFLSNKCYDDNILRRSQMNGTFCDSIYDAILCWEPTPAGETAFQPCPSVDLSDTTKLASRTCNKNGQWLNNSPVAGDSNGWSNYSLCFPEKMNEVMTSLTQGRDLDAKYNIVKTTRKLETIGFSLSLVMLILSFFTFTYFRALRNKRTKIHKLLMGTMIMKMILRLILYIDEDYAEIGNNGKKTGLFGIVDTPFISKVMYILLEYLKTSSFIWMFIEGIYLYTSVVQKPIRNKFTFLQFYITAWYFPAVLTLFWVFMTFLKFGFVNTYWNGYKMLLTYLIQQLPRMMILTLNTVLIFLIMYSVTGKIDPTECSEVRKAKKSTRGTFFLLPILAATNILSLISPPLDGSILQFSIWCYTTHFLRSFQGTFISLIYCFLNEEVQTTLKRLYKSKKAIRKIRRRVKNDYLNEMTAIEINPPPPCDPGPSRPQDNAPNVVHTVPTIENEPIGVEGRSRRLHSRQVPRTLPVFNRSPPQRQNRNQPDRRGRTHANVTSKTALNDPGPSIQPPCDPGPSRPHHNAPNVVHTVDTIENEPISIEGRSRRLHSRQVPRTLPVFNRSPPQRQNRNQPDRRGRTHANVTSKTALNDPGPSIQPPCDSGPSSPQDNAPNVVHTVAIIENEPISIEGRSRRLHSRQVPRTLPVFNRSPPQPPCDPGPSSPQHNAPNVVHTVDTIENEPISIEGRSRRLHSRQVPRTLPVFNRSPPQRQNRNQPDRRGRTHANVTSTTALNDPGPSIQMREFPHRSRSLDCPIRGDAETSI